MRTQKRDRVTAPLGEMCPSCGEVHTKCAGHSKRSGKPCGVAARKGQEVCRLHGGSSPQAIAAARARELEEATKAAAQVAWALQGEAPVEDPLSELVKLAGEVVAWKNFVRDQTTSLDGILTYWVDRDFYGPDGEIARSEAMEQVRAIVTVYERAQDRAAKILATIVKLDIAERMTALRTTQATAIVDAVRQGLSTVDLEAPIRAAALEAIADRLDQISEPPPALPKELTA